MLARWLLPVAAAVASPDRGDHEYDVISLPRETSDVVTPLLLPAPSPKPRTKRTTVPRTTDDPVVDVDA